MTSGQAMDQAYSNKKTTAPGARTESNRKTSPERQRLMLLHTLL